MKIQELLERQEIDEEVKTYIRKYCQMQDLIKKVTKNLQPQLTNPMSNLKQNYVKLIEVINGLVDSSANLKEVEVDKEFKTWHEHSFVIVQYMQNSFTQIVNAKDPDVILKNSALLSELNNYFFKNNDLSIFGVLSLEELDYSIGVEQVTNPFLNSNLKKTEAVKQKAEDVKLNIAQEITAFNFTKALELVHTLKSSLEQEVLEEGAEESKSDQRPPEPAQEAMNFFITQIQDQMRNLPPEQSVNDSQSTAVDQSIPEGPTDQIGNKQKGIINHLFNNMQDNSQKFAIIHSIIQQYQPYLRKDEVKALYLEFFKQSCKQLTDKPDQALGNILTDVAFHLDEETITLYVQGKNDNFLKWAEKVAKNVKKCTEAAEKLKNDNQNLYNQLPEEVPDDIFFSTCVKLLNQLDQKPLVETLFKVRAVKRAEKEYKTVDLTPMMNPMGQDYYSTSLSKFNTNTPSALPEDYKVLLKPNTYNPQTGEIVLAIGDNKQVVTKYKNKDDDIIVDAASNVQNFEQLLNGIKRVDNQNPLYSFLGQAVIKGQEFEHLRQGLLKQKYEVILSNQDQDLKKNQIQCKYIDNKLSFVYFMPSVKGKEPGIITIEIADNMHNASQSVKDFISYLKQENTMDLKITLDEANEAICEPLSPGDIINRLKEKDDFIPALPQDDGGKESIIHRLLEGLGVGKIELNQYKKQITDPQLARQAMISASEPLTQSAASSSTATETQSAAASSTAIGAKSKPVNLGSKLINNFQNEKTFAQKPTFQNVHYIQEHSLQTPFHHLCANKKASGDDILQQLDKVIQVFKTSVPTPEGNNFNLTEFIDKQDKDGNTALNLLCQNQNIKDDNIAKIITLLKEAGAGLNIPNNQTFAPLHYLTGRLDIDIAFNRMIELGAEIDCKTSQGLTPLYTAGLSNQQKKVDYLLHKKAAQNIKQTAYSNSASTFLELYTLRQEHFQKFNELLNKDKTTFESELKALPKGTDYLFASMADQDGKTLLHHAVEIGADAGTIQFLIEKDANISAANKSGKTPFDIALEKNSEHINLLLDNHPELKSLRENIKKPEESYIAGRGAGVVAAAIAAVAFASVPLNAIGTVAIVGGGVTLAAFTIEAVTWGVGRVGYEIFQQYKSYGDANIGQNFTKSMNELKTLEQDLDQNAMARIASLEESIVTETKKWAPNIEKIQDDANKAHILRCSLLKTLTDDKKQNIAQKSEELTMHLTKWVEIQQGRETSKGFKELHEVLVNIASFVIPGVVLAAGSQNANIGALAGAAGVGLKTFVSKYGDKSEAQENKTR